MLALGFLRVGRDLRRTAADLLEATIVKLQLELELFVLAVEEFAFKATVQFADFLIVHGVSGRGQKIKPVAGKACNRLCCTLSTGESRRLEFAARALGYVRMACGASVGEIDSYTRRLPIS